MCQLIEVTGSIWKLSADQLIVLLDREQCSISYFLASLRAQETDNAHTAHILDINVVSNLQLSKQGIRWPVSLDRIAGSCIDPSSKSSIFWSQMIAGSSLIFLKIRMKYVVYFCRTIQIFISNWPRKRKFSHLLQAGKTVAFDFAHHDQPSVTLFVQF